MVGQSSTIDAMMERASAALVAAKYFECEKLCQRGLSAAWRARDVERLSRICLPLQESRRLIRQQATDAAQAGAIVVMSRSTDFPTKPGPGFYLAQPPLIGADARRIRDLLWSRQVPSLVLAREPMTQTKRWPIVAVGERSVRVQVEPPAGVTWTGQGVRRDEGTPTPTPEWFLATAESIGDAAFKAIDQRLPAIWRVEDLLIALDAFPDHEKLHQHLADACRAAMQEPAPTVMRPRNDGPPNCF